MSRKLKPVSPGEMLAEEFLEPLDMSNYRLARPAPERAGRMLTAFRASTHIRAASAVRNGSRSRARSCHPQEVHEV